MLPTRQGSIHLFRIFGIDIYLHWLWFLWAFYGIRNGGARYTSLSWNVIEYLLLFCIILLHELGHALACRQVGGKANEIILWPFGGVAYVSPPPRPGATLWSIAAGPLVNVLLAPALTFLVFLGSTEWADSLPNLKKLIEAVCIMNYYLLIFNLLPIYPLDGGQILRSLLWFLIGRANSLLIASIIGFVGVAGLIVLALVDRSPQLGLITVLILFVCWRGLLQARALAKAAKLPRREGFACPSCKQAPYRGALWRCSKCFKPFDTFESMATCPNCGTQFPMTQCFECGTASPIESWVLPTHAASASPQE